MAFLKSPILWIVVATGLLTGLIYGLNHYIFPIRNTEGEILYGDVWRNFISIALVLWTLAVICVQAYIYHGQWQAMQEGLKETKRLADTTHEALTKLERPFIFVSRIDWRWRRDANRDGKWIYTIHPILENSGNTPTKDLEISIAYKLCNEPMPANIVDVEFPNAERASVSPKGTLGLAYGVISDEDLLAIQKKEKYFYVIGKIVYRDNFEGTSLHNTRFCRHISTVFGNPLSPPLMDGDTLNKVELRFVFHSTYNDVD